MDTMKAGRVVSFGLVSCRISKDVDGPSQMVVLVGVEDAIVNEFAALWR